MSARSIANATPPATAPPIAPLFLLLLLSPEEGELGVALEDAFSSAGEDVGLLVWFVAGDVGLLVIVAGSISIVDKEEVLDTVIETCVSIVDGRAVKVVAALAVFLVFVIVVVANAIPGLISVSSDPLYRSDGVE